MTKIILNFNNKNPLWETDDRYNELLIRSYMSYLDDKFEAKGLIIIKDIFEYFMIDYDTISTETLLKYWRRENKDDKLDIEYKKNDDGSYTIVCDTDN